jgi:hypothetical protein
MVARPKREFKRILGISLGGGRGKNTAVACLHLKENKARVRRVGVRDHDSRLWYDDVLTEAVLGQSEETLVAMDVPLTLPACVCCPRTRCLGIVRCPFESVKWLRDFVDPNPGGVGAKKGRKPSFSPYTQRVCEKFLEKEYGVVLREALGHSVGPLTARAQHLTRRWSGSFTLNENLLEVRPRVTVQGLFGRKAARDYHRGPRTWATRAGLLEELTEWMDFTVWREPILQSRRCFNALLCGFTALLWIEEGWEIPEEFASLANDGWIWAPSTTPPKILKG